jgi:hypothetical protein
VLSGIPIEADVARFEVEQRLEKVHEAIADLQEAQGILKKSPGHL